MAGALNGDGLRALLPSRTGHFALESGHHGELWLDLDALFLHPSRLRPLAQALARRLAAHRVDAVCGPLTGGALVAAMIAEELEIAFFAAGREAAPKPGALYSAAYRLPAGLRREIAGRRLAIVDDVINAGSALRATHTECAGHGADVVAAGALLTLGTVGVDWIASKGLPLETLERMANRIWKPEECPLCRDGVAMDEV